MEEDYRPSGVGRQWSRSGEMEMRRGHKAVLSTATLAAVPPDVHLSMRVTPHRPVSTGTERNKWPRSWFFIFFIHSS